MLLRRRHRYLHRRGESGEVPDPVSLRREGRRDSSEVWDKVRAAFAGRADAEVFVYEGAEHGFNCTKRASFDPEASKLARSRTLELLRRTIGPRT